jgi:hypothetical protein
MSQKRLQSSWYESFQKIIYGIVASIDCSYLAVVTRYDDEKHVADILPLMNTSYGESSAQFLEVPMLENCYRFDDWLKKVKPDFEAIDAKIDTKLAKSAPKKPKMKKGAVVLVVCLDGNTDNWDGTGVTFTPETNRRHDANDSIIVGVI